MQMSFEGTAKSGPILLVFFRKRKNDLQVPVWGDGQTKNQNFPLENGLKSGTLQVALFGN